MKAKKETLKSIKEDRANMRHDINRLMDERVMNQKVTEVMTAHVRDLRQIALNLSNQRAIINVHKDNYTESYE